MSEHKLASAADFKNDVNEEDCYEPAREILLPKSQKWVLLRRPKPLAYTLVGAPLPGIREESAESATVEVVPPGIAPPISPAEKTQQLLEISIWAVALWVKVFVHPKVSLRPGPDEIHPEWIHKEDQTFIWAWIRGEVGDSGESLGTFPAKG